MSITTVHLQAAEPPRAPRLCARPASEMPHAVARRADDPQSSRHQPLWISASDTAGSVTESMAYLALAVASKRCSPLAHHRNTSIVNGGYPFGYLGGRASPSPTDFRDLSPNVGGDKTSSPEA